MQRETREQFPAFDPCMWKMRSQGGYDQLGWVHAKGPIEALVNQAALRGDEIILDAGTGTRAILESLAPQITTGSLLGFDVSREMLQSGQKNERFGLFQADICKIPFPDNSTDLVTARMIFHHLPDIPGALGEIKRVLKPGGSAIIGEYVAADDEVWEFERRVFDIKEAGRHLWTGPQLARLVSALWKPESPSKIELGYGCMEQYSVRNWMGKSGLPQEIQMSVLDLYLGASPVIIEKMNINFTETENGPDALVDRPFAFVKAEK